MEKRERNWEPLPLLDHEGYFLKNLPLDLKTKEKSQDDEEELPAGSVKQHWTEGLTPWQRLYSHHTLASVRKARNFYCPYVQHDDLDFVLWSTYQHGPETFPEKVDTLLQPETQGLETWRILRNQRSIAPPVIIPRGHPCIYGGIREKKSIHHVKLGIGSYHSAQTNAGFSRKEDGSFYAV